MQSLSKSHYNLKFSRSEPGQVKPNQPWSELEQRKAPWLEPARYYAMLSDHHDTTIGLESLYGYDGNHTDTECVFDC